MLTFSHGLLRMVDNSWGLIMPHMYPLAFSSMGTSYPAAVALVLATAAAMAKDLDHKDKVWLLLYPQRLRWQLFHIVVNSLTDEGQPLLMSWLLGTSRYPFWGVISQSVSMFVCRSWCRLFRRLVLTLQSAAKEKHLVRQHIHTFYSPLPPFSLCCITTFKTDSDSEWVTLTIYSDQYTHVVYISNRVRRADCWYEWCEQKWLIFE